MNDMPRTCTVCTHPDRNGIDNALLGGEPFRHIAKRTGTSTGSLQRHKKDHIAQSLSLALEVREQAHGESVLSQVEGLRDRTIAILDRAEQQGDLRSALGAVAQAKALLELLWRAEQEAALEERHDPRTAVFDVSCLVVTPHSGPVFEGEDDEDEDEEPREVIDVRALGD